MGTDLQKVACEWCNILAPLTQGRQPQPDHIQAVQQVFAEQAELDPLLQILVRSRNHPHIGLDRCMTTHAVKTTLAQNPQQARLQLKRHIANFIEEQGTAIGLLKAPAPLTLCAGESAPLVAEQFALEQLFGDSRRIDGHEWTACARRVLVQSARDQLLAGAGFAGDQHGDMALAQAADGAEHILHRGCLSHHFGRFGVGGVSDFFAQTFLHGAADQLDGFGQVKRFGQVLECPTLERADRAVEVGKRGHDDHRQARIPCLHFFQ